MEALTPSERRGALVVVCLLALGAGHDLWRAARPLPRVTGAEVPSADPTALRAVGGDTLASAGGVAEGRGPRSEGSLDLNQATARELEALPGIGPVLAARIIAHRQRYGPFGNPDDLMAVRGIGPRLLARLSGRLRTGSGGALVRPDSLPRAR